MTFGFENIPLFILILFSFLYLAHFLGASIKLIIAEGRSKKANAVDDWDEFLSAMNDEDNANDNWVRTNIKWSGAIFAAAICFFVFSHALEVLNDFLNSENDSSDYWLLFFGKLFIGLVSVPVTLFSSLGLATIFGNLMLPKEKTEFSDSSD